MCLTQTIFITGATGTIGPRVVQALSQAGFRIRSFSIDAPAAGMFPQSVEVLLGDVTDQTAVQSALSGVDAVVHMAALLHLVHPPPAMNEKYERVNIGGTATVVEAAIKEGVQRVVLFSTIAVYGPSNGCVLNEMSPTCPDSFYAQTKLAAEHIVLKAKSPDGRPLGTVLRLGAVYGSRIKGNYERLTRALARHRFIPVGNGLNRRTLVYDKDVGRAALLAVSHPAAAGRIFNVTDGKFHTMNEIIESICSALGRRPPALKLPVRPVRRLAGIIEDTSRICGLSPPVAMATVDKYTEDVAVDGRKFCREIGFVPQYDLQEGWRETVTEMRRQGGL
jgi:nucleoside-diphosphate-sugar epimerase